MEKKMSKFLKEKVELFIESLEEMIDSRDDMWEEEKNCNPREMWKIRDERYEPARERVRNFLMEMVKDS